MLHVALGEDVSALIHEAEAPARGLQHPLHKLLWEHLGWLVYEQFASSELLSKATGLC